MNKVILYYKYVSIKDTLIEKESQKIFCRENNLKGRIIIASEGINGTIEGTSESIDKYKQYMDNHPLFFGISFKEDLSLNDIFPRLQVRIRDEIVTLNQDKINIDNKAPYIEPSELKDLILKKEEFYLVDARNIYETKIGKFKNAITLDMQNFRDLPVASKKIDSLKKKKIVTYCTGGVRCEKASAFLLQKGFKQVYQLHGGIINYGKYFPDGDFVGKCYVFDGRIAIDVNNEKYSSVISHCHHCNITCDQYINCSNKQCNKHFISCKDCEIIYNGTCSNKCKMVYKEKYIQNNSVGI